MPGVGRPAAVRQSLSWSEPPPIMEPLLALKLQDTFLRKMRNPGPS